MEETSKSVPILATLGTPTVTPSNKSDRTPMSAKPNKDDENVAKKLFSPASAKKNSNGHESSSKTISINSKTPDKAKKTPSSSSKSPTKAKRQSLTSAKKKRQELLEQENEILDRITALKKEKQKVNLRIARLGLEEKLKFPVKDELIEQLDKKGKPCQPLPKAHIDLSENILEKYVHDAVGVWDFLNVFKKQLGITSIHWEDFVALLSYQEASSTALNDLFTSLMRLILSDSTQLQKLSASIPKQVYFGHKLQEADNEDEVKDRRESILPTNMNLNYSKYDTVYNGLKLLPRKLNLDMLDNVRYQVVLRAIILRLDPVKRLRKAMTEVVTLLQDSSTSLTSLNLENDEALEQWLKVHNMFWSQEENNNGQSMATMVATPHKSKLQEEDKAVIYTGTVTKELMHRINTPKLSSKTHKYSYVNKDAVFNITSNVLETVANIYNAAKELELKDLYQLKCEQKLQILKVLCEACYDTSRIRELLETNAEERMSQITQMNKIVKENKQKQREANNSKRPEAIIRCRKLNYQQALEKATKGAKGRKSIDKDIKNKAYDPTQEQILNMIEEMCMLEHYDIDYVVEDFELMVIDEEEEDEGEEDDGQRKRSKRSAERRKERQEAREHNDLILITNERIDYALERNTERELRSAIKYAERAGFKDEDERRKIFITQKLKAAYKALYDLEQKLKEDKLAVQHEQALEEYFVRTEPLGSDRHGSLYWRFRGEPERVFKQTIVKSSGEGVEGPEPLSIRGDEQSQTLCRLFQSRPGNYKYTWCVYTSNSELFRLCEALDERGEREGALKRRLLSLFSPSAPEGGLYEMEGNEYIGRKVRRRFGKKVVVGRVVGYFPPGNGGKKGLEGEEKDEKKEEDAMDADEAKEKREVDNDPALWRILHSDGDEEDLELHELLESLLEESQLGKKKDCHVTKKKVVKEKKESKMENDDDEAEMDFDNKVEEEEEDEGLPFPEILRSNAGLLQRGLRPQGGGVGGIWSGGQDAVRGELLRLEQYLYTTLQKYYPKDALYTSVKQRMHSDLKGRLKESEKRAELVEGLLELEDLIHSLQQAEDRRDAEQAEKEKKEREVEKIALREEMAQEGWVFASDKQEVGEAEEYHSLLGCKVRRYFSKFGISDGLVTAVLPPKLNEGQALFRVEHDDGDEEDLDSEDVTMARDRFATNATVEEMEAEDRGADGEGEESEREDSDEEEESDPEEAGKETKENHDMFDNTRLWPTREVRNRWRKCVQRSSNSSELAWAIVSLEQQAWQFSVLGEIDDAAPLLFRPPQGEVGTERRIRAPSQRGTAAVTAKVDTSRTTKRGREEEKIGVERKVVSLLSPRKSKRPKVSYKEASSSDEEEEEVADTDDDDSGRGKKRESSRSNVRRSTRSGNNSASQRVANREDSDEEHFYNSGRPTRSAANKVSSYAE